jgi:hypothetical protein
VLALIAQGKSNKLIADALTMSESTVKAHVKQIIKRLHVANRTQAALMATGSLAPQSPARAEPEKPPRRGTAKSRRGASRRARPFSPRCARYEPPLPSRVLNDASSEARHAAYAERSRKPLSLHPYAV